MKVLGAESTVASSRQVACSGLSQAWTSSAGNSASRRSRQRGQASIRSVLHNDGAASRIRIRARNGRGNKGTGRLRSEEHTSELQSLMRISYAVFCLKKKKTHNTI